MRKVQCVDLQRGEYEYKDIIDSIKDADFDGCFLQLYKKYSINDEQFEYVQKVGLSIEFVHLDYSKIMDIWKQDGDYLVDSYYEQLDYCHKYNVHTVVMHLMSKSVVPENLEYGLIRLNKIANYAQNLGINIAFENTRSMDFAMTIIAKINKSNVGFCYDCGHNNAYNKEQIIGSMKDRIFAVHLHDNHGIEVDEHLLPFDGNVNWQKVAQELKNNNYKGALTLESHYDEYMNNLSLSEFYKKSFESCKRLEGVFEKLR